MALVNNVIKKLKEMEFPILDIYYKKNIHVICSDILIISCENKNIFVLFHVGVKADKAANIILELNKIEGFKKISAENLFVFINNLDNIVIGDDAIAAYDYIIKKDIINKYIEEQKRIFLLSRMNENEFYMC